MTPLQIITIRAPSFASEPNVNDLIDEATKEVSDCLCDLKNKGVALIVMHWLALSKRDPSGTSSGTIKSEKEGDLARSYAVSNNENVDSYYGQTTWGLEYLRLLNGKIMLPRNRMINEY